MASEKELAPSQNLVSVSEVRQGIAILKNGGMRSILRVQGVNFELKSSEDQSSLLNNWQNFLNSLDFSLEVVALNRRLNIERYLNNVRGIVGREENEYYKAGGEEYINFISDLTSQNNILKHEYYIVIPFDPVVTESGVTFKNLVGSFFNLNREAFTSTTILSANDFERYSQQLLVRQDNTIFSLNRMGLTAKPLNTQEVTTLIYNLYNPSDFEKNDINVPESLLD
ncbi:MAG: hypothetical protein NTX26_01060 [Candidatus Parcubacteria bacterium]|nr:hypothetical protein [Candidatus Parcubacteria bacterium]